MECLDLDSTYLEQSMIICLTVTSTPHFLHMGGSFLAMRWLCVAKVCTIRRLFIIVSYFLFKPGFLYTWILFFIVFNLVFCFVHFIFYYPNSNNNIIMPTSYKIKILYNIMNHFSSWIHYTKLNHNTIIILLTLTKKVLSLLNPNSGKLINLNKPNSFLHITLYT